MSRPEYSCHVCERIFTSDDITVRPDGSYDCPECGYTYYAVPRMKARDKDDRPNH